MENLNRKIEPAKTHIYVWLENPENKYHIAHRFLRSFIFGGDDDYIKSVVVTCKYKNKYYRCVGASRLGDVWLHSNMSRTLGYEKRVDIDDCYFWTVTESRQG